MTHDLKSTTTTSHGLRSDEIDNLRKKYGYNEVSEHRENLVILYLKNFWGPLPWALEVTILITFFTGNPTEAFAIIFLFFINAGINIYQHQSANAALDALRKKIQIYARAMRDKKWETLPVRELLPNDVVHLQMGDIVPADAVISDGELSVDSSMLTGESLPKDIGTSEEIFSGGVIRRGEATATVIRIGANTRFGKTTELLETSHAPTHVEHVIFAIIKYFFIVNIVLVIIVIIYGVLVHIQSEQIINFVIVLLLMSVPVAFPAMFAVAQSYGALQMGRIGKSKVLVRRLAGVQDGAMMDVLCSDKTGTLTTNHLSLSDVKHYGSIDNIRVLALAGLCSNKADSSSIDDAVFERLAKDNITLPRRTHFEPFDALTKRTKADFIDTDGKQRKVDMGLPKALLTQDVEFSSEALEDANSLADKGARVLAIVSSDNEEKNKKCDGVIALSDPIRPDAGRLIQELSDIGIRTIMISGDGRKTAGAVASELGLTGEVFTPADLHKNPDIALHGSVFAEAYPEDKIAIIKALQKAGHTVGMTGDGVNDAPALRQAEIGVAVESAVDVAKQSASFILTSPGLEGVVHLITVSRAVYSRLRTWALNKVIKSIEVIVFTSAIFFITRSYILSPLLGVLLLFANDFISISIATDKTGKISLPVHWDIGKLILGAGILAMSPLILIAITYGITHILIGDTIETMRTIAYVALVYYGITTLASIRSWPTGFSTLPSKTIVYAILFSFALTFLIGVFGLLVVPISLSVMMIIIVSAIINYFAIEMLKKMPFIRRLIGVSA